MSELGELGAAFRRVQSGNHGLVREKREESHSEDSFADVLSFGTHMRGP
jgi:hypothetical protein